VHVDSETDSSDVGRLMADVGRLMADVGRLTNIQA
jgi:hypothetical protein